MANLIMLTGRFRYALKILTFLFIIFSLVSFLVFINGKSKIFYIPEHLGPIKFYNPRTKDGIDISETKKINEIAFVVVTCYRLAFTRCLDSIQKAKGFESYPYDYYISNGCNDAQVEKKAKNYTNFTYLSLSEKSKTTSGYGKICQHFRRFLSEIFDKRGYNKIIVVEDDLEVSSDFLEYFSKMQVLLDSDPSVLCISAWNDNGYERYTHDPFKFHRTEFFPGLGWMITRTLWDEFKHNWPSIYWDEYFRDPKTSKGRTCVYPEVSRVENFGKKGESHVDFFMQYVEPVKKNRQPIDYAKVDLELIKIKNYTEWFLDLFNNATDVSLEGYKEIKSDTLDQSYKIVFSDRIEYQELCQYLGITDSTRYSIPRTSFHKITHLNLKTHRLFIYPSNNFIRLD